MNNVEENYYRDANSLVHGCFPQMELLYVYNDGIWGDDKNGFTEQCFLAKMQIASLERLCTSSVM
jgi:hypothetical protein